MELGAAGSRHRQQSRITCGINEAVTVIDDISNDCLTALIDVYMPDSLGGFVSVFA